MKNRWNEGWTSMPHQLDCALSCAPRSLASTHLVTPFSRRHADLFCKRPSEGRHRLIADRFSHDLGGHHRFPKLVCCQAHPNIKQQLNGSVPQRVMTMPRESGTRHTAKVGELSQAPSVRRIIEHGGNGWQNG